MGANLMLAVAGLNKIQTGRRCIASVGGKLSAPVITSIIRVQNLQISAVVSVCDLKICVILHRELRIEGRTCHQLQHGFLRIKSQCHSRKCLFILLQDNAVCYLCSSFPSTLKSSNLYAHFCLFSNLPFYFYGIGCFLQLICRCYFCSNLTRRNIQRLSLINKFQADY